MVLRLFERINRLNEYLLVEPNCPSLIDSMLGTAFRVDAVVRGRYVSTLNSNNHTSTLAPSRLNSAH